MKTNIDWPLSRRLESLRSSSMYVEADALRRYITDVLGYRVHGSMVLIQGERLIELFRDPEAVITQYV